MNGTDSDAYHNPGAPVHIVNGAAGNREKNDGEDWFIDTQIKMCKNYKKNEDGEDWVTDAVVMPNIDLHSNDDKWSLYKLIHLGSSLNDWSIISELVVNLVTTRLSAWLKICWHDNA